jgi:hypothetical protein
VRAIPYTFNDETEKLQNLKTGLESITVIEAEQKTLKEEIKIVRQEVAI